MLFDLMYVRIILTCVLFWAVLFFAGKALFSVLKIREKDPVLLICAGGIAALAVFQLISVPLIALKAHTRVLTAVFAVLILGLAAYGVYLFVKEKRDKTPKAEDDEKKKRTFPFIMLPVILLVLLMAGSSMYFEHEDWDDAEVVSLVTDAVQNDTMLLHHRELGHDVELSANLKRVVSPYQMLEAALSILSGIHPAIFCHTLMPFFLIVSAFLTFYAIGTELFSRDLQKIGIFLLVIAVIYLVCSYSTRNGGFFFLVRSWQGKSMVQALAIPLVLWRLFALMRYPGERNRWQFLFLSVLGTIVFTNTMFLASVVVVTAGILPLTIREKRPKMLLYGLLTLTPCLLYGGIFAAGKLLS